MSKRRFVSVRPYFRMNGTFVSGHRRGWPRQSVAAYTPSLSGCNPFLFILQLAFASLIIGVFLLVLCWPLIVWILRLYVMFFVWIVQLSCVLFVSLYRVSKLTIGFAITVANNMGPMAWLRCVLLLIFIAIASIIYSLN